MGKSTVEKTVETVEKTVEVVGKTVGKSVETVGKGVVVLTAAPGAVIRGVSDLFTRRSAPVGAPPGTLAIDAALPKPKIRVLAQNSDGILECDVHDPAELPKIVEDSRLTWIDVQGLGDEGVLKALAELFTIHRLALADVVHTPQRPKVDSYPNHELAFVRMLGLNESGEMDVEQLSVLIGDSFVITFQENYGDPLEPVRVRFRERVGPIGELGGDYLSYAIIDTVVDGYFPLLEAFADRLDDLEEQVMSRPRPDVLMQVQKTKRTLIALRRSVWPLREALNMMLRDQAPRITEATKPYLRDTYDHCVQVAEVTDSYREIASELTNTYMSVVANRTNDVMKVLTIMASIFIPLTVVAGIYGMNFDHMPELHQRWGYPAALVTMVLIAGGMLLYFRKKGWLGESSSDE